jgi:hypothetical protein
MTKEKTKTFQHYLTIVHDILLELGRNLAYAQFLYEGHKINDLNEHRRQVRYAFFRLILLDLAKMFTENKATHKTNLFRLLTRMEVGDYKKQFSLPAPRLAYYRNELSIHEKAIEDITKIRNIYIAHTDELFGLAPSFQFFPEVKELLTIAFALVNECRETILQKPGMSNIGKIDLSGLTIE